MPRLIQSPSEDYEEAIIDGVLHNRRGPDGKWLPVNSWYAQTVNRLAALSEERRHMAMSLFCRACGRIEGPGPSCNCWNDE